MADASPLIALERIGRLELPAALYDEIVIPEAVYAEVRPRSPDPGQRPPGWLRVQRISDVESVRQLLPFLHPGEAEAIVLAKELSAPLVIDEKRGRAAARTLGVQVTGTLALLLSAKSAGLLDQVTPVLQELAAAGFHLSSDLLTSAQRAAGEA